MPWSLALFIWHSVPVSVQIAALRHFWPVSMFYYYQLPSKKTEEKKSLGTEFMAWSIGLGLDYLVIRIFNCVSIHPFTTEAIILKLHVSENMSRI